jgi:hypothetical protein
MKCPHCKKGEIHVHPGGRMCGCDTCHSVFRYPSMVPFPVQHVGAPNGSALWALAEEVVKEPKVETSHYGGKYIATFEVPS